MTFLSRTCAATLSGLTLCALAFLTGAGPAGAQQLPSGPVRVIVPYGAGSYSDVLARKVANRLSERTKVNFVVENLVGAGGVVGTQALANAAPNGNTIGLIASNHAMNAAIYPKLSYDPLKSFAPIAYVTDNEFVIVVNPSVPAKTFGEYLALAREKPGQLSYGSPGIGSSPHLAVEKMTHMAGVQLKHVPYRETGQMLNDLLSGRIGMVAYSISPVMPHIRDGKLRPLAVTGSTPSASLPDIPPIAQAGVPGYYMKSWNGFIAPAGTPEAIVSTLGGQIKAIVTDPQFVAEIAALNANVDYKDAAAFEQLLKDEIASWKKLVVEAGIKPE